MRQLQPFNYIDAVAKAGSIRKAALSLAITSTALNRRILALEEEMGVDIFERLPTGVRLSAAGELLLRHVRNQMSDMERVKSQIEDLRGVKRGHISIACSQAILTSFLPTQIAEFRKQHPSVTFDVQLRDRAAAEKALVDLSADIALVFEPVAMAEFQTLLAIKQPVCVIMPQDHSLAGKEKLYLRDCLQYPLALPTAAYGVRALLETRARQSALALVPAVESDSFEYLRYQAEQEGILTFQIEIGLPANLSRAGLISRMLDKNDVPPGVLYLGQLKNRALPVAAAQFANQLAAAMDASEPREP
jgi:DNA-binding transcriptional LysR family regulator